MLAGEDGEREKKSDGLERETNFGGKNFWKILGGKNKIIQIYFKEKNKNKRRQF